MSERSRNARRRDVRDRLADSHASRRRRVDQRERRALAHRHRLARVAVEIHQRDRDVGDRHLPRSDHRIARAQAADGAIADRHQKRLVGDRRQLQHAIRGVPDGHAAQARATAALRGDVLCTSRVIRGGLPSSTSSVHVDGHRRRSRGSATTRRSSRGRACRRPRTDNARARRSHAKRSRSTGANREHVALLRLVAPDLARRHAGFLGRHRAQVEAWRPRLPPWTSSGKRVGQPAGADVVDRQDRIRGALLPAAVDHLLRASLDFRVAALHGVEVEVGGVGARCHRRRRAAAHADQHARAAELDQQRTFGNALLVRVHRRGCCRRRPRS